MGRAPCCDKANVKRGPWSPEEDEKLKEYIEKHGTGGNWIALPQKAGLKRCGKSCRLRWLNYLRPNLKHGQFSEDEDRIICTLYATIGSRWSIIASQLPGRTDNDVKNYWNTKLKKKMMEMNFSSLLKKPHHQITLLSMLQNQNSTQSSSLSSSSSSSPISFIESHNNNSFYPQPSYVSFNNGSESISLSSTLFSGNYPFQAQEGFFGHQNHYNQVNSNNFLMIGGDANSCTSSDGSCNNQINHQVKEGQFGYGRDGTFSDQINYLSNGVEDPQKLMLSSHAGRDSGWTEEQSRLWGENPLDYGLEEIKQLVSTSSCNNFLFDDYKTEERVMY